MADIAAEKKTAEMVFGVVAAVGTPVKFVTNTLDAALRQRGYESAVLHLSSYTKAVKLDTPWPQENADEYARISTLMKRGNELREKAGQGDILAAFAAAEINSRRSGEPPGALSTSAFILRQLKHPDEIYALRRIYGEGFLAIGVYCPKSVRRDYLMVKEGMSEVQADDLIARDENEPPSLGQKFRDTFYLADVFIEAGSEDATTTKTQVDRFLDLLFGTKIISPYRDEYAMFLAHAAALRSSSLARQVGAAILSETGEILALGSNEVPRFGGGQYWEGEKPDARDHVLKVDASDTLKTDMVREILQNLEPKWMELSAAEQENRINSAMTKLKATRVMNLTEFTRAVHAEMETLSAASRTGVSVRGATLYTTTFPCHGCAKHIVVAGITRVVYVEPYPKSLAIDLHNDSIAVEEQHKGESPKVRFEPFVGIAPRRFDVLFSTTTPEGMKIRRKDAAGNVIEGQTNIRISMSDRTYIQRESDAARMLKDFIGGEQDGAEKDI
jgi:deoxycytidylate deaminase